MSVVLKITLFFSNDLFEKKLLNFLYNRKFFGKFNVYFKQRNET